MSRIPATFETLKAASRRALIPYVTSGFPLPSSTVPLMHALVASGADIIELGVPFSDPMADGPVVQRAGDKALAAGIGLGSVLDYVKSFRGRDDDTPVVLMGYCNPVERMGMAAFAARAAEAGVDGVLLVDCPPEEAGEFAAEMRRNAHRSDLSARTHHRRGPLQAGGRTCQRLCLLRVAQGRHRRRPHRHDACRATGAEDPAGHGAAGRSRDSASRTAPPPRGSLPLPMRW